MFTMKSKLCLAAGLLALTAIACGDDAGDPIDAAVPIPDQFVPGIDADTTDAPLGTPDAFVVTPLDVTADITADTTWTRDHSYTLKTHIFVRSGTLTIQSGVTILGDTGSSLVVTSAGQIDAQGTATEPVVFTSSQPVGSRVGGDWGGVVLLGLAPINITGGTAQIEGFPAGTMGTTYGGTAPTHDCGTLMYVEIQFAGFLLAPGNELNGLTVGACGSGTTLDFIHVHQGSDDGIEFFGGTADIKHLIVSQNQDDGLDWDYGWIGRVQYVIVQQSLLSNQGIEADNNGTANDALPRSMPTIYNATLVGSDAAPGGATQVQKGMHLRRGTAGRIHNAIVAHFADFPIDVDGAPAVAQTPANLFIKNSIFFDNGNQVLWADATDNDAGFDEGAYFRDAAMTNSFANREVDPQITTALSQTAPNFMPPAGSPALTGAATPPNDGFFNTAATFVGAVGATDWTLDWTTYPQN